jgi:chemotaxis protein methyltransferase CheR
MDENITTRPVNHSLYTTVAKNCPGTGQTHLDQGDRHGNDQQKSKTRPTSSPIFNINDLKHYRKRLDKGFEQRTVNLAATRQQAKKPCLREGSKPKKNHELIIGQSDALKYVLFKVGQIAHINTTVLILGETGTGKGLAAQVIHRSSLRRNRAMITVNCANLPANLIESELFGHEKGAFTGSHTRRLGRFEVANGTTLFLDEIGELPLGLQAKLMRVIQDGEFERLGSSHTIKVDTRIIAATNRNLEEEVRKGRFREDLWYRLNIFPITIPPLRDRLDDIPLLVDFYVKKIGKRLGKTIEMIPAGVMNALQDYSWPGNVRELENILERAVITSPEHTLRLVEELRKPLKDPCTILKTLEAVERDYIIHVLEHTQWKVSGKNSAAEILGLDRSTLRARMCKFNIERPMVARTQIDSARFPSG